MLPVCSIAVCRTQYAAGSIVSKMFNRVNSAGSIVSKMFNRVKSTATLYENGMTVTALLDRFTFGMVQQETTQLVGWFGHALMVFQCRCRHSFYALTMRSQGW